MGLEMKHKDNFEELEFVSQRPDGNCVYKSMQFEGVTVICNPDQITSYNVNIGKTMEDVRNRVNIHATTSDKNAENGFPKIHLSKAGIVRAYI